MRQGGRSFVGRFLCCNVAKCFSVPLCMAIISCLPAWMHCVIAISMVTGQHLLGLFVGVLTAAREYRLDGCACALACPCNAIQDPRSC